MKRFVFSLIVVAIIAVSLVWSHWPGTALLVILLIMAVAQAIWAALEFREQREESRLQ